MYNENNNQPQQPVYPQQPIQQPVYQQPVYPQQAAYQPQQPVKKNGAGATPIIVAIVVIALVVGVMIFANKHKIDDSKIYGVTWNCVGTAKLKFDFNKDGTFLIHNKGINENYIKGNYTKSSATGSNPDYSYSKYEFVATETYLDGETDTDPISQTYIVGIDKSGERLIIYSTDGDEDYTCTK